MQLRPLSMVSFLMGLTFLELAVLAELFEHKEAADSSPSSAPLLTPLDPAPAPSSGCPPPGSLTLDTPIPAFKVGTTTLRYSLTTNAVIQIAQARVDLGLANVVYLRPSTQGAGEGKVDVELTGREANFQGMASQDTAQITLTLLNSRGCNVASGKGQTTVTMIKA
ncbi:MAG: hypothetical protein DHS80DRAFT_30474 [Piptocephalis tieghemiana]|nr:MAG: hypothetical protein DHS80DRAFT_30474 [Piptocephalis tieghemiana]